MAKVNVKKLITQGSNSLRAIMQDQLQTIGSAMVEQVMKTLARLPESQRMNAIANMPFPGVADYKASIKQALAIIAADALDSARADVPKAKDVKLAECDEDSLKLGEFERLPFSIRAKMTRQYQLMTTTQLDDLAKTIAFQFTHSVDSTDSLLLIRSDLDDVVYEFATGPRVTAGAASLTAQITNETRNDFFSQDDVKEEIEAMEFMNEDPVSPVCQDLAGTIFEVDDPNRFRYTPPLHFNCKSWFRPILRGNLRGREITTLKPSTKKIEDSIQFSEDLCCGGIHIDRSRVQFGSEMDLEPVHTKSDQAE